ncbi:uncharacterized protein MYCGRDRAFT_103270 [Zymoseptoria tritici IPO323]|uniref:Uncharacterized protein n=1 Tax=Zymoseptoria tritici (strain CBS 115943 / IPO323) TaxID=336722 RepID=F9X3Q7_ZYMTI|nr:uncharacterized protein MYCGRDRAFT_103270 [Zymoseptoria tritici IPO323]EGP90501.1 hypothetical protein MYCGRDRAFT_103270 [Zymoseptoria tritici IPO323]
MGSIIADGLLLKLRGAMQIARRAEELGIEKETESKASSAFALLELEGASHVARSSSMRQSQHEDEAGGAAVKVRSYSPADLSSSNPLILQANDI